MDARVARDAMDARDASLQQFAQWCTQGWGFWSCAELSWSATTYLGALQLGHAEVQRWSRPLFEAFAAGAWILHWTDDTVYWVAKPTVHLDAARRPHHERHAALESDVEDLYFWHGVLVPAFVVMHPDSITLQHIDEERNAEVRRVMIQRYGQPRYLQDSGAVLVHQDEFGKLWRKERPDDSPIEMVEVINSTPEPDGTAKHYWLRVQPGAKTAHEAVASTWRRKDGSRLFGEAKEYQPQIET